MMCSPPRGCNATEGTYFDFGNRWSLVCNSVLDHKRGCNAPPPAVSSAQWTVVFAVILDLNFSMAYGVGHGFSAGIADLPETDFFNHAGHL